MMADDDPADHYAALGLQPEGSGVSPVQRVMQLARLDIEEIKHAYKMVLQASSGNPFKLAKISQAFQVLSGEGRKLYDLQLMEKAAMATRQGVYSNCINFLKHIISRLYRTTSCILRGRILGMC